MKPFEKRKLLRGFTQAKTNNTNKLSELLPQEEIDSIKIFIPANETPLWKHWKRFVKEYIQEGRSKTTIRNSRDKLRFVIRALEIYSIEQLNQPVFLREKLFETMGKRDWSTSTINSYVKDINTYFIWLKDMELIQENKLKNFRKCKETPKEQHVLQENEVKTLISHVMTRKQNHSVERWRNTLFIECLVLTGARPCELAEIQYKDIEKKDDKYVLTIQGRKQKGKIRRYTLPSRIRDAYEMYVSQRRKIGREESNLFISLSKRTGWTYKGMTALMKRLSKELGFRINAYAIRRFVATKLYKENVPLKDIMTHLGHTRLSTTLRYVENGTHMTQSGVDVMGKMF